MPYVGRHIYADLSDKEQRAALIHSFESYMDTIDELHLKGISKVWLYNHYIIYFIAWPFLIYDFPPPLRPPLPLLQHDSSSSGWESIRLRARKSFTTRPRVWISLTRLHF